MSGAEPLLDVRDLSVAVSTRSGPATVVDGISFAVGRGEALGVVGESGCGKSITALSLLGLLPPGARVTGGQAWFEGRDLLRLSNAELRPIRRKLQVVFQDPYSTLNPRMTVAEALAEPLLFHKVATRARVQEHITRLLADVGLPQRFANTYPPSGCRFHTRCPIAVERCAQLVPEWREATAGHWVACHRAPGGSDELPLQ